MDVWPVLLKLTESNDPSDKDVLTPKLAHYLNHLLLHDFSRLVQLLYRVDVDEKKVKAVLQQNPEKDAGTLLADLLIERQKAKNKRRDAFSSFDSDSQEERW